MKKEEDKVYKLKKALYGLKQAPRAWYNKIEAYFVGNGFDKCLCEHTLFTKSKEGGTRLSKDDAGTKVDATMFKQVVDNLMYGVNLINRFMSSPTESHWFAGKRILRYLKGTTELGNHYKKRENTNVVAYTDSDFAGDIDDQKNTSGFVFLLGSGAISWSSKKQPVVSLSTTEAEYIV